MQTSQINHTLYTPRFLLVLFLCVVLSFVGVFLVLWRVAGFPSQQAFGTLITHVPTQSTPSKQIALTFDDGPMPVYTERILQILHEQQVPATFFVVGEALEQYPEEAKRLLRASQQDGHELGNHSYSHQRMVFMPMETIAFEIEHTNQILRDLGYTKPIHFRPPYGKKLLSLPWYLAEHNITSITWDVEAERYTGKNPEELAEYVAAQAQAGSIVLLHVMFASRETSLQAVPLIIQKLRAQGYTFVTVSQMIGPSF